MSLKKSFSKDKTKCTVTFTVEPEAAQGAQTVNVTVHFVLSFENDFFNDITNLQ